MATPDEIAHIASRFSATACQFCSVVDSASSSNRTELLSKLYRILPVLISEAISLPDASLDYGGPQETAGCGLRIGAPGEHEWRKLYNFLKEKLGDWDLYHQVFDPTKDSEAICGTLADDIADIYRDLRKGLAFREKRSGQPDVDAVWTWHLLFYSHWGKHAMDALLTIHFRLQNTVP